MAKGQMRVVWMHLIRDLDLAYEVYRVAIGTYSRERHSP
jgi:hypothetical protein